MFSFFKKKNPHIEVPEWANFLTAEEYTAFMRATERFFKKRKLKYRNIGGVIEIEEHQGLKNIKLGLLNVSQNCKMRDLKEYPEIVNNHFEIMLESQVFMEQFDDKVEDFEAVKKYIGVRIYQKDYAEQLGKENAVLEKVSEDLYAMLVFDLPTSVMNVQPGQVKKWNISADELMRIGRKNMRHAYPPQISKQSGTDIELFFISADHFFSPNIVLDLEIRPDLVGTHGALVGIPHRHSVMIYPIENLEVVKAINVLLPAIIGMHRDGPGSLSDKIYWYYNDVLEEIPYELEEEKVQMTPTENFVAMLNSLGTLKK